MSDQSEAEKVARGIMNSWKLLRELPMPGAEDVFNSIAQALHQARQEKALTWFKTPNPLLGNVRPIDMIRAGRGDKLCKWIDQAIQEGNKE